MDKHQNPRPRSHASNKSSFIWKRSDHQQPHAIEPVPGRKNHQLHQKAKRTRTALDQPPILADSTRAATKEICRGWQDQQFVTSHMSPLQRTCNRPNQLGDESNSWEAPERKVDRPKRHLAWDHREKRKKHCSSTVWETLSAFSQANQLTLTEKIETEEAEKETELTLDLTPDLNYHLSAWPKKPHIHSLTLLLRRSKTHTPDLHRGDARKQSTEKGNIENEGEERRRGRREERGGRPTTMEEEKRCRPPFLRD